MKSKIKVLAAVTLSALSLTTFAGVKDQALANETKAVEARFAKADKNGDGKLTLDEAKSGMPLVAKDFSKIDVENKGYVTLDQVKAALTAGTAHVAANVSSATASATGAK